MKILVTGGAGFIGSHVVDAYVHAGHDVWVVDNLSRGKRENVNTAAHFLHMDLHAPELRGLLMDGAFDCVNHHAAQIDVRVSVADPVCDAGVNVIGSLKLLEAARAACVPRVIFASTGGAIYGAQHRYPADEGHPTAPQSPYGVAKLAVEHYLEYYRQVHGLRYAVLRYANVYGPRQDPEGEAGVVAIFAQRILDHKPLTVYGDGGQTRDYVYVRDVARASVLALAYLARSVRLAERQGTSEPGGSMDPTIRQFEERLGPGAVPVFNIGTGVETSVLALAATLLDLGEGNSQLAHQPARPGEQARSCIDATRARAVLGWTPSVTLRDGLRATLDAFRAQRTAPLPTGAAVGSL